MNKCPNCGQEYEGKFCPDCGAQWQEQKTCPNCGAKLSGLARFCNDCGYSFAQEKPAEKKPSAFKQKLSAVLGWLKAHLKIVIPTVAAIVVLITVISVTVSVTSDKFRVAKVSKIQLGYTQEQVLKTLGEPYADSKSDTRWQYFGGNYTKLLDKIAANEEAMDKAMMGDNESKLEKLFEEAFKLEQQLETITYKYIEVNFSREQTEDNKEVYKVSSILLDKAHSEEKDDEKKQVKKVEISNKDSVYYYIDNTISENYVVQYGGSEEKLFYTAKFTDGSYYSDYIYGGESEISGYTLTLSWSDNFAEYKVAKEAVKIGEISTDCNFEINYCSLKKFIIPDYVTSITIADNVTSIGESAFSCCSELTSITIGKNVTSIESEAFYGCRIETVYWNATACISVRDGWNSSVFSSCGLEQVVIGENVTTIPKFAFSDCSGLTSVTIPDGVTRIGEYAFSSCSELTSVTISNSVTSIELFAFSDCESLTDIDYNGTKAQWDAIIKAGAWDTEKSYTVHCTDGDVVFEDEGAFFEALH